MIQVFEGDGVPPRRRYWILLLEDPHRVLVELRPAPFNHWWYEFDRGGEEQAVAFLDKRAALRVATDIREQSGAMVWIGPRSP